MESKHKSDYGQWKLSAGKFYGDAEADKGIQIIFSGWVVNSLKLLMSHVNHVMDTSCCH